MTTAALHKAVPAAPALAAASARPHLAYVDALRVILIMLVVDAIVPGERQLTLNSIAAGSGLSQANM